MAPLPSTVNLIGADLSEPDVAIEATASRQLRARGRQARRADVVPARPMALRFCVNQTLPSSAVIAVGPLSEDSGTMLVVLPERCVDEIVPNQ
jgi:hypothetical protein